MKKKKTKKILYWITTIWLAFGMLSGGIMQLLTLDIEIEMMNHLGYPVYFLAILGIWKIAGVIAILVPRTPVAKEWAYAGFFLAMSGAIFSHIAVGDGFTEIFPALLTLALVVASYLLRPKSRKVACSHTDCTC